MLSFQSGLIDWAAFSLIISFSFAVFACCVSTWRLKLSLQGLSLLSLIVAIAFQSGALKLEIFLPFVALAFFYVSSFHWEVSPRQWHKPLLWLGILGLLGLVLGSEVWLSLSKYQSIMGDRLPAGHPSFESIDKQGLWLLAAFNVLAGLFWLGNIRSKA